MISTHFGTVEGAEREAVTEAFMSRRFTHNPMLQQVFNAHQLTSEKVEQLVKCKAFPPIFYPGTPGFLIIGRSWSKRTGECVRI